MCVRADRLLPDSPVSFDGDIPPDASTAALLVLERMRATSFPARPCFESFVAQQVVHILTLAGSGFAPREIDAALAAMQTRTPGLFVGAEVAPEFKVKRPRGRRGRDR